MIKNSIEEDKRNFTKKIAIIGMGYVGAGIAYSLMIKDIAREMVFIDVKKDTVNAEMLDIRHGMHNMGSAKIKAGDYSDIKDCDLIIITAGRNRLPGESRTDLLEDNIKIMDNVLDEVKKYYNQGVILIVANPVDLLTYYTTKKLGLPKGRVFGTGCVLDSSRLTNVISDYVDLGPEFVDAIVVGEHGQNQIPLWSKVRVAQMPIQKFCKEVGLDFNEEIMQEMAKKVLNMGAEIIAGKGKTYYGISTCVCYIADAILNKRTLEASVSSVLDGQFGISDVSLSLPSLIDYTGVKHILPIDMSEDEELGLQNSAKAMKEMINSKVAKILA